MLNPAKHGGLIGLNQQVMNEYGNRRRQSESDLELGDMRVVNTVVPEWNAGFEKGCTKGQAKSVTGCSIITGGESFDVRPCGAKGNLRGPGKLPVSSWTNVQKFAE
jgi:hypothetical protein